MSTSKLATQQNQVIPGLSEPVRPLSFLFKRQYFRAPENGNTRGAAEYNLGRLRSEAKISTGVYLVGIIWVTVIALGYLAIVIR